MWRCIQLLFALRTTQNSRKRHCKARLKAQSTLEDLPGIRQMQQWGSSVISTRPQFRPSQENGGILRQSLDYEEAGVPGPTGNRWRLVGQLWQQDKAELGGGQPKKHENKSRQLQGTDSRFGAPLASLQRASGDLSKGPADRLKLRLLLGRNTHTPTWGLRG